VLPRIGEVFTSARVLPFAHRPPNVTTPSEPVRNRIPELDGLRGIAVLMVIAYHYLAPFRATATGWFRGVLLASQVGWLGVNLFFVLSGYLIASILIAKRDAPAFFRTFYIRRFCRILPLYVPLVIGMYFLHQAFFRTPAPPLYTYFTFTQNFWMAAKGTFGLDLLAVTWSLAVEEQFYVILPALVRFTSPKQMLRLVVACICLAPILRGLLLLSHENRGFAALVLFPTNLDALMIGVLVAWILARGTVSPSRLARLLLLAGALIVPVVVLTRWRPLTGLLISFACAAAVVAALRGVRFLRWKPLRYTGFISYGLYLLHQPVNWAIHRFGGFDRWDDLRVVGISFVAVYVVAALSWEGFEKWFVRYGHRFHYERESAAAIVDPLVAYEPR